MFTISYFIVIIIMRTSDCDCQMTSGIAPPVLSGNAAETHSIVNICSMNQLIGNVSVQYNYIIYLLSKLEAINY